MTAANLLLTLLHWISRHLVALGFFFLVVIGWFWREQVLPDRTAWSDLTAVLRGAAPPGDTHRNEIPKGAFRPAAPINGGGRLESRNETRLERARQAFWLDRHAEAERLYREYVAEHPHRVDGHGELGNLLLTLGRESEARSEYRETIRLLEHRGRRAEADRLRDLLANQRVKTFGLAGEADRPAVSPKP